MLRISPEWCCYQFFVVNEHFWGVRSENYCYSAQEVSQITAKTVHKWQKWGKMAKIAMTAHGEKQPIMVINSFIESITRYVA